ncbi:MAG: HAD family phosphatase [Rhodocyclaceae bacterium]|nr:HAD family phosphatase [Rhodocyclaceae bacterium]MBX3668123.1 HAD family phosphatase [Rhodocyclaceae bacterium]
MRTVIFDLGGVLIDWNPRYLYDKLIADSAQREHFLSVVCPQSWNEQQDAGRSLRAATDERIDLFPQHAKLIEAYYSRWPEMLAGPIAGSVALLRALAAADMPLYALTNWSAELFPIARERFDFLKLFRGIVVSGAEGLIKPDPALFRLMLDRYSLAPPNCFYIDDNPRNIETAVALGMMAHHYVSADALALDLRAAGLIG